MKTLIEKHTALSSWRRWVMTADAYSLTLTSKFPGAPVEGDAPPSTSEVKLLKADIAAILAAPANAYSVWACFEAVDGIGQWRNVYAETLAERLALRTYFSRIAQQTAYALLVIPPLPMEAALSLTLGTEDEADADFVDEVIDRAGLAPLISATLPHITLAVTKLAAGSLRVTATSMQQGAPVDITGAELRWETTAGVLNASRSTFVGSSASVLLQKPISEQPFKIKCGFKYFAGVAEVMVGG